VYVNYTAQFSDEGLTITIIVFVCVICVIDCCCTASFLLDNLCLMHSIFCLGYKSSWKLSLRGSMANVDESQVAGF